MNRCGTGGFTPVSAVMTLAVPDEYLVDHYPNAEERAADGWIHTVAIVLAGVGTGCLTIEAASTERLGLVLTAGLYGTALICMLAFSALYNFSGASPARPFLRRLDEAGIFLMIAGSHTPFTQRMEAGWAIGMTFIVWTLAIGGIVCKLALSKLSERTWTIAYVLFGCVAIAALAPAGRGLPTLTIFLLLAGGLIYAGGCVFFLNPRMRFRRAVWHGFVCVAASLHFVAISVCVGQGPAIS